MKEEIKKILEDYTFELSDAGNSQVAFKIKSKAASKIEAIISSSYISKDKVMEIVQSLEKYNQLLSDECTGLVGMAAVHGWKSSRYEAGVKCREEIANLKKEYGL